MQIVVIKNELNFPVLLFFRMGGLIFARSSSTSCTCICTILKDQIVIADFRYSLYRFLGCRIENGLSL